jgi:hypothetical protein
VVHSVSGDGNWRAKGAQAVQSNIRYLSPFFPFRTPGHRTNMSCCGNPRPPQSAQAQSRSVPVGTVQQFPVSHQPTAHPGITPFPASADRSTFRPPNITSPQPVHSLSPLNGTHSPPPTASTAFSLPPASPSGGPQMGMFSQTSVVDPTGTLNPLRRPSLTYSASGNQNILSTYQSSPAVPLLPPTDDGKMSVSIDFGEHRTPDPRPTSRSN